MIRFLFATGIIVVAAIQIANIEGQVVIEWQNWRIVSSVAVLTTIFVTFGLMLALFHRAWRGLLLTPSNIKGRHKKERMKRGYRALTRGMVAVAAGDPKEAQR